MKLSSLTQLAIKAAKKASRHMMRSYLSGKPNVSVKKGKSLVTNVDIECNDIIVNLIKKYYPSHNIITEEADALNQASPYTVVYRSDRWHAQFYQKKPSVWVLHSGSAQRESD